MRDEPNSERLLSRTISRRTVLRGALVGGAALTAATVLGCGDDEEDSAGGSSPTSPAGNRQTYRDPGISDTEIKIGTTQPLTGPIAPATAESAPVREAYIKYVNDQGGVNGRKLNLITYDDSYDPARGREQTRRLMEQDNVFALVFGIGTPVNAAILPLVEAAKIPQLLISSGTGRVFDPPAAHPWTIGQIGSYFSHGKIVGNYIAKEVKDAKVAVLQQNDDFGQEFLDGFKAGMGSQANRIVSVKTYEPTDQSMDAQVISLKDSGANVLYMIAVARPTILAFKSAAALGWKPQVFLSTSGNSNQSIMQTIGFDNAEGAITLFSNKDPLDPQWENDAAMKEYKGFMAKYAPNRNVQEGLGTVVTVRVLVEALGKMKEPTRQGLMDSIRSIKGFTAGGLTLAGVTFDGSKESNFLQTKATLGRFTGGRWQVFGGAIDASKLG